MTARTAEQAGHLGFLSRVVPDDDLPDEAFGVAMAIAQWPVEHIQAIKSSTGDTRCPLGRPGGSRRRKRVR